MIFTGSVCLAIAFAVSASEGGWHFSRKSASHLRRPRLSRSWRCRTDGIQPQAVSMRRTSSTWCISAATRRAGICITSSLPPTAAAHRASPRQQHRRIRAGDRFYSRRATGARAKRTRPRRVARGEAVPGGGADTTCRCGTRGRPTAPTSNRSARFGKLEGAGRRIRRADAAGHVAVVWHAMGDRAGEGHRTVYIARSSDDGASFAAEAPATPLRSARADAAECERCSIGRHAARALSRRHGRHHRDTTWLMIRGASPRPPVRVHPWELQTCPMSTYALAESGDGLVAGVGNRSADSIRRPSIRQPRSVWACRSGSRIGRRESTRRLQ